MKKGLAELRSMQKSVERFTRRQLEAQSLAENLRVIFDEYSEQMGRTCYAELVRSRLPAKLGETQRRIDDLLLDSDLLQRMQAEVLRRDASLPAGTAMARVRNQLEQLSRFARTIRASSTKSGCLSGTSGSSSSP